jgi:hypothetical protein
MFTTRAMAQRVGPPPAGAIVNAMETHVVALALQVMMATSLAACAGLRAWLPLLALGALGRLGLVALHDSFDFLSSTPALVVFGVATVVEVLADKVIALDHALDALSTFVRPAAGAVLAAAALTELDPLLATLAGLVLGGGTALTVHAGKAAARAKTSAFAPVHGGLGNAILSLAEDAAAVIGVPLAVFLPVLAFVLALCALGAAVAAIVLFVRAGRHLLSLVSRRVAPPPTSARGT